MWDSIFLQLQPARKYALINFNSMQQNLFKKSTDNQICSEINIYLPFGTLSLLSSYWSNQSHQNLFLFTHFFIERDSQAHNLSTGSGEGWLTTVCIWIRKDSFLREFHTKHYTESCCDWIAICFLTVLQAQHCPPGLLRQRHASFNREQSSLRSLAFVSMLFVVFSLREETRGNS